jgi:two-component system, chemotaxis family, response regulator PixG
MTALSESIYQVPEGLSPSRLMGTIQQIIVSEVNGRIDIHTGYGAQWQLYFQVGRIVWASGGEHRFRRWWRLLKFLKVAPSSIQLREDSLPPQWEHFVLSVMVKRQRITRDMAQSAIEINITEVLFDMLQSSSSVVQVSLNVSEKALGDSPVTIIGGTDEFLVKAQQNLKAWQQTGLADKSPNLAPSVIAQLPSRQRLPGNQQTFLESLDGHWSLRDLAISSQQDLANIAQKLVPYMQQGLITLQPVADLPAPKVAPATAGGSPQAIPGASPAPVNPSGVVRSTAQTGPLIACIDDSPQVGYILEEILRPLGYRVLAITEPVEAVGTIIRQKPAFVFLDLVMPIVGGYELCSQIRRVGFFKHTPIVILTGNDGVVDRMRAKVVGATDFLSKPINQEKLVGVVQKYLETRTTH